MKIDGVCNKSRRPSDKVTLEQEINNVDYLC